MENVLKIIYDRTIKNDTLNIVDVEKILELLVIGKSLNNYILNIEIQPIRSNNLASYSAYTKKITIYSEMIEKMIKNIEANILNANDFELMLYKNLSILQILLHEIEHANQQKKADNDNNLEAFIIRLSYMVDNGYDETIYEYCPEERLAEVKSSEEIINIIKYLNCKLIKLPEILDIDKLQRLLRGYHYNNFSINIPIETYFTMGNRKDLSDCFDWNSNLPNNPFSNITDRYDLQERLKYGFPISTEEYVTSMKRLVLSLNRNFRDRINIKIK